MQPSLQNMQSQIRGLESKMYFFIFFLFCAVMASIIYNTAVSIYIYDKTINTPETRVFHRTAPPTDSKINP